MKRATEMTEAEARALEARIARGERVIDRPAPVERPRVKHINDMSAAELRAFLRSHGSLSHADEREVQQRAAAEADERQRQQRERMIREQMEGGR